MSIDQPSSLQRTCIQPGLRAILRSAAGLAILLVLGACAPEPLLSQVVIEPDRITPDMDGQVDVARIAYRIGRPALLDIELIGSDGEVHVLREARRRSAGDYEALFGGVIDGRMLPDDRYTVRLTARPRPVDGEPAGQAEPQVVERSLEVRGGDVDPPRIEGLAVQPEVFSPNQDGLGDRVTISYRLSEPAEVRVWLAEADGDHVTDILETVDSARHAGEPGPHQYDFDAGIDAGAEPPPDGDYRIIVEARDASGNLTREETELRIQDRGLVIANLLGDVEWSDSVVELGQTLWFTTTVENSGDTPLRSFGPEPGFVYGNRESFNQTAPMAWLLLARRGRPDQDDYRAVSARVMARSEAPDGRLDLGSIALEEPEEYATSLRLGDDDEAGDGTSVRDVCGRLTVDGRAATEAEAFLFFMDGDRGRAAEVAEDGRFCFEGLPTGGEVERSWARSPGAMRLGLEYDEKRTDLGYPWRWQLGPTARLDVCDAGQRLYLCLPPGALRPVWGGLRFDEPPFRRSSTIYLALEHEDVRSIQGPYDPTRIQVESP